LLSFSGGIDDWNEVSRGDAAAPELNDPGIFGEDDEAEATNILELMPDELREWEGAAARADLSRSAKST
jgi:hypothetical protein